MSDWINRYNARKQGAPPRPAPPPPPQYAQPVYQQPVPVQAPPQQYPAGYPQPVPGAPPHAPFGYDPATGVPVAPYGYDPQGRVVVMPYAQPQPPQAYQQPVHQPNGLPAPQGYGQPPYGQVQAQPGVTPQQAIYVGEDGQQHIDWAQAPKAWQGGQGSRETVQCTSCGGDLIPTDAPNVDGMPGASVGVFNATLGKTVYPAPHCARCGTVQRSESGPFTPGGSTGAMVSGIGVKVDGPARAAPGGGSVQQVASQHGLPNLFAP